MRRNTALTRIMASGVAAIMLCAGGTFTVNAAEEEPVKADVSVKAIQGLSDDFIGGMDVSSMLSLEESGVTFKNANGEVEDLFTLLKESGVNYVRLRVWNDPFTADGQGYGRKNPANGIWCQGIQGFHARKSAGIPKQESGKHKRNQTQNVICPYG